MKCSLDVAFCAKPVMSAAIPLPMREDVEALANGLNLCAGEMQEGEQDVSLSLVGPKRFLYLWPGEGDPAFSAHLRMFNMTLDQNARALRLDMKLDFKYYVAPENLDMCDVVRSTAWAATRVIDERIGTKSYSFGSITSKINVDRVNNIFSFYIDLTPNFDEYMPIDDQMRCECYPYLIGTNYRYLDRANKIISGLGPVTGISVPGKQLPFILSNLSKIEARDVKDFYVKLRPSFIEESGRADRLKEIAASY